jgi:two-component system response regulator
VEDGAEALDFLFCRGKYVQRSMTNRPKVVLLDLKLPKLNGLEVLQAIKTDPQTRTIPVVMITSSAEDPDIKAAYDLGANSYVVKPVDFETFVEAMSHIGFYWLLVNQPPT